MSSQWRSFPDERPDVLVQPQLLFGSPAADTETAAASKTRILHTNTVFITLSVSCGYYFVPLKVAVVDDATARTNSITYYPFLIQNKMESLSVDEELRHKDLLLSCFCKDKLIHVGINFDGVAFGEFTG